MTAGGDRFVLVQDGRPVAGVEVVIVTPTRTTLKQTTDAAGTVAVAPAGKGRYLLTAAIKEPGGRIAAGPVGTLHRITTTSYMVR